jgi:chemotaxis family two-component system response regulator Rcp1
MSQITREILCVDDSPADQQLLAQAFEFHQGNYHLNFVNDGEEALQFLLKRGRYADAKKPHLIISDLNMPRKNGKQLATEIKSIPDLKRIPILILSTSSNSKDIQEVYDAHVNGYLVKPDDFDKFEQLIGAIQLFWLNLVEASEGRAA